VTEWRGGVSFTPKSCDVFCGWPHRSIIIHKHTNADGEGLLHSSMMQRWNRDLWPGSQVFDPVTQLMNVLSWSSSSKLHSISGSFHSTNFRQHNTRQHAERQVIDKHTICLVRGRCRLLKTVIWHSKTHVLTQTHDPVPTLIRVGIVGWHLHLGTGNLSRLFHAVAIVTSAISVQTSCNTTQS